MLICLHHNLYILTRLVKLNSKISISIHGNDFLRHTHYHKQVKYEKKIRRLHVFGNGHDLFDALENQACFIWRRIWYFWTEKNIRSWHMCFFRHLKQILIFLSFFFFIFTVTNFHLFKSGSIKKTIITT